MENHFKNEQRARVRGSGPLSPLSCDAATGYHGCLDLDSYGPKHRL